MNVRNLNDCAIPRIGNSFYFFVFTKSLCAIHGEEILEFYLWLQLLSFLRLALAHSREIKRQPKCLQLYADIELDFYLSYYLYFYNQNSFLERYSISTFPLIFNSETFNSGNRKQCSRVVKFYLMYTQEQI